MPVRVYNNSTITGLAGKASDEVRANGWTVAETGNYSQGTIPTTTVYFRPGTDEEASAKELGAVLRARVEPRFDGIQHAAPGIILIVTNDYQGVSKNK
ncbi:LytR C-terminal domain-containing protein [Lentzea sp. NPDC004782]|uniref:LytR C-terminal domain-containing protein n=1 Tax=Lentzea sp. NPDC004782 TaxID=3154458 RepID=UPI0033BCD41D